jgi:hypothetical protein
VTLVIPGLLAQREVLGQQVPPEQPVLQDLLGQQERQVQPDQQVLRVPKEPLVATGQMVPPVLLAPLDPLGLRDQQDPKEHRVPREIPGTRVQQDPPVLPVLLGLQEVQGQRATQGQQGLLAQLVQLVLPDLKVILVQRGLQERLAQPQLFLLVQLLLVPQAHRRRLQIVVHHLPPFLTLQCPRGRPALKVPREIRATPEVRPQYQWEPPLQVPLGRRHR